MRLNRTITSLSIVTLGVALGCGASKNSDDGTCLSGDCNNPDGGGGDTGGPIFDIGGDGSGLDGAPVFQDISLNPLNATIYIDTATTPPTPATQDYTAKLNLPGGGSKDVTSEIVMRVDDSTLGSFTGHKFTSVTSLPGVPAGTVGGKTTVVHGDAESKTGEAQLTVVQLRKTGDHRDFYFVVPYLQPPSPDHDVLKFGTNIKQVDVAFVTDTTGSMTGAIDALKTGLSSTIMPGLSAAIPSVGLAVVDHKDNGDVWDVKVLQLVTTDVTKAESAVSLMSASGGGDEPESQENAMYHTLTGEALPSSPPIAAHTPAPGTSGGVDFRAGSLPVVALSTDAHWHDSVTIPPEQVDMAQVTTAYTTEHAKFVGIVEMHAATYETTPFPLKTQFQQLSDSTGSHLPSAAFGGGAGSCPTGVSGASQPPDGPGGDCRLVFEIMNGAGLGDSVIKAIQAISVGSTFDVTAVPSNDPTNAAGTDGKPVDATKFIKDLRAMDEGSPANACPAHAAVDTNGDGVKDTFKTVVVGTPVCFEIDPQENTTVKPKGTAQFFNAFIDVLGMPGSVKLDHRVVLFLVPPSDVIPK